MAQASIDQCQQRKKGVPLAPNQHFCFDSMEKPATIDHLPIDIKPLVIQTHPQHAILAAGDSGGPLLAKAPDEAIKVVGIASEVSTLIMSFDGDGGEVEVAGLVISSWEPVAHYGPWIESIREGKVGNTLIFDARNSPLIGPVQEPATGSEATGSSSAQAPAQESPAR